MRLWLFCSQTYSQSRLSRVRGKFSALPTPGSDIVLNRASNTLVPCDRVSCPMANLEPEPLDSTAPAKLHINYTQLLGLNDTTRAMLVSVLLCPVCVKATRLMPHACRAGVRRHFDMVSLCVMQNMGPGQDLISGPMLNRLVYYTFPEAFYISSRLPKDGKVQAMRLFEYLTNSNNSWSIILDPNTGTKGFWCCVHDTVFYWHFTRICGALCGPVHCFLHCLLCLNRGWACEDGPLQSR